MTDTEAKAQIIATDGFVRSIEWPDPTPKMLDTILFDTIWRVIKSWDINVPNAYSGYMGATGNHARAVYDALAPLLEATEARHAAEMRELKERFSEAAGRAVKHLDLTYYAKGSPSQIEREAVVAGLAPFILPALDPLVEIAREMTLLDGVVRTDNQKAAIREGRAGSTASEDFYDRLRAAMQARGYEWRKIGEAGE